MPSKPDLLYVSPVVPLLTGNGLAMRAGTILEALASQYEVHLLIAPLYAPFTARVPDPLRDLCRRIAVVAAQPQPSGWFGRGLTLGRQRFDVVHVFRLSALPFAQPYFRGWLRRPRRHLDLDDIESVTRRRVAELYRQNGDAASARGEEAQAARQQFLEEEVLRNLDRLYVCSALDREKLAECSRAEVCVLPNAIRLPSAVPYRPDGRTFTFLFVGTLGYYPNEDAVHYLCREIVPRIRRRTESGFQVNIVGAGGSGSLRQAVQAVGGRWIGPVAEVCPWYAQADAVVVPVRAGGGTRIKILEAFSYGRPTVSTSIGMEGIEAEPGKHILIGDTPEEFAAQCVRLIADRPLRSHLALAASALVQERYSMDALKRHFAAISNSCRNSR